MKCGMRNAECGVKNCLVFFNSALRTQHSTLGFTLIELILTIVILGLIGTSILMPISTSLQHSPTPSTQEVAIELAKQRMDLILAQKQMNGLTLYADPCPGPALCTVASGYTVTPTITTNWQSNTYYHEITVTVSGNGDAVVKTVVADYGET